MQFQYEARIYGKDNEGEEIVWAGHLGNTATQALNKAVQAIHHGTNGSYPYEDTWFMEIRVFELHQVMRRDVFTIDSKGVALLDYAGNKTEYPR